MTRAILKVGQKLRFEGNCDGMMYLRGAPDKDMTGSNGKWSKATDQFLVTKISANRRQLSGNSWWIHVQKVTDPTCTGWLVYNVGGWDKGERSIILAVGFEPKAQPAKRDVSCE